MKSIAIFLLVLLGEASFAWSQTVTSTPDKPGDTLQLQLLTRKIEEQNAKIDLLSQHILKLEQQISTTRPGIMIGENEMLPTPTPSLSTPLPRLPGITTHTVERGETLTSIARQYGVGIGELQRFNHIDDPLKLRAGQTIMIPPAQASASPSPNQ
jgi:LysM repeat protein